MKTLLVVLNPREIPVCVESIERVPTARVWLRGWTETEIETQAWPVMMRDAKRRRFTHYAVMSDDGRLPVGSWHEICRVARDGHPVVTGYSNMDMNRGFTRTNQCKSTLPRDPIQHAEMEFWDMRDIVELREDTFPSSFHGYACTMMTREIAEEFPFACYRPTPQDRGHSSDFHHSRRLADAGIDIVACRDAFVPHIKPHWNSSEGQKLVHVNRMRREIIWDD